MLQEFKHQALADRWGLFMTSVLSAASVKQSAKQRDERWRLIDAWLQLGRRVLEDARARYIQDDVALICEKRIERVVPRRRCTLSQDVFNEVKHILFHLEDEHIFHHLGVFRERGNDVEVWVADALLHNAAMVMMLDTIERARQVKLIGAYQLIVAREIPIITPWQPTLTMQDVHIMLLRALGLQPAQYRIKHRGVDVVSRAGRFVDLGIYAGACLQVVQIEQYHSKP